MSTGSPQLDAVAELCREAALIAQRERRSLVREFKSDGSIVTSADRAIETFLRRELEGIEPDAAIWGEEFGFEPDVGPGIWLIDPIDGTSNFAFGSPLWGISVAFAQVGAVQYGVLVLPDLDEQLVGLHGGGAWMNGNRLDPIPPGPIEPYELVSLNDSVVSKIAPRRTQGKRRDLGSFVVSGAFMATQRVRSMVCVHEKLYDAAATICICRELQAQIAYVDESPFEVSALINDLKIDRPWHISPAGSTPVL